MVSSTLPRSATQRFPLLPFPLLLPNPLDVFLPLVLGQPALEGHVLIGWLPPPFDVHPIAEQLPTYGTALGENFSGHQVVIEAAQPAIAIPQKQHFPGSSPKY